jgi:hypothetical protein
MQTFDQCLTDLVTSGEVTFETAKAAASNPSDFELKMKMFSRLSQTVRAEDIPPEEPAAPEPEPASAGAQLDGLQSSGLDFLQQ